jgi:D-arabinose 1-dehydrogenase-like Zn-dependent alcohol dehydrogenase
VSRLISIRYLELLNPFGKVYPLEIDFSDMNIPFQPFLFKELRIIGECSKTAKEMDATLKFAADNGIKPILQKFPFTEDGANDAIKALKNGTIKYRGVIVVE